MPQGLTVTDLDHARALLGSAGPGAMYDYLAAKGFKYAVLANGVAKGDSVAGEVAINFMKMTASDAGHAMSDVDVNRIRGQMANEYLNALSAKLDTKGVVSTDITHSEAWNFHSKVFNSNGLPADAWTLNSVFTVLGESSREGYWQNVLDSAGSVPKELELSAGTDKLMSLATQIGTAETRQAASRWINRVDSPSGVATVVSSLGAQFYRWARGLIVDESTATSTTPVSNLIDIDINPNPQPQQHIQGESKAQQDVANGYIQNAATHSIYALGGILSNTDFTSTQMASLASGGIRPGEVQLDPNARPNSYLSQFYTTPDATKSDFSLRGAVTLNGLSAMSTFNTYVDPLLLDLTGNGVHMTDMRDGVLFDTDHSGTLKRSGWADRTTGMLVIDDGSGQIKDVSQMFSEYYGGKAGVNGAAGEVRFKDGFAALASEDSNKDGVIDQRDPIWSKLRVWVDGTHDAKVDAGELKTLAELGITQINVRPTSTTEQTRDGNKVLASGSFIINGKSQETLAVDFLGDPVSNTLSSQGTGTRVTSTTSGSNSRTTSAYASQSTLGETLDAGKLGVNNLYGGSGDDTLIAASTGSWLVGGAGSNTYNGGVGDDVFVVSASDNPANIHGNGGRDTAIVVGDKGMVLNMAQAGLTIAQGGSGDDTLVSGGNAGVFIKGGSGNSTLVGGGGNDVLVGGTGHNTIIGGSGKSVIYAGSQGDVIYGSEGGSIIHAGGGADIIYGGAGNDVIEVGHGNATIDGDGGINLVTLHGNHGDYRITRTANGYEVADKVAGRDGTVTLKNIQKLNFSDISAVDLEQPNAMPVADVLSLDKDGKAFDRRQPHLISAASLLANDQVLNSKGGLRIANVGDAIGGTVSLTQQGDVLFTPDPKFKHRCAQV